jgi:NAD(P)-dependent dehydrogenase (short-subunit alcohol dehydrogenase family)
MGARFVLAGRRALVTGAASGIGKATALELARRGARVVLADIDARGLEQVKEEGRALGGDFEAHALDVADAGAVDAFAERVQAEGPVDLLVNNAGVAVVAPFARTAEADWDWILGVNLHGTLRLTRAVLPAMTARRSGHVVVVASVAGLFAAPGMVAYTTTKFALVGFAEGLRLEVANAGIGVTVVCPGYVKTNLHGATRYDNPGFKRFLDDPPAWYGMSKERVAREIASAVEARKGVIVLGPEKIGWYLKRVAPEAAFAFARWVARRAGVEA